jgi:hypothetical protein
MQAACVFAEKRAAVLDATDNAFARSTCLLNLFANLYTHKSYRFCVIFSVHFSGFEPWQ